MAQSAQIAKVNHWHQRLADWLITNPASKLSEAAKHFGKTQAWISTVIHSDAFQDYYQKLSADHSTSILSKAAGVAGQALDALGERLEKEAGILPINTLLEISDVMLKRAAPPALATQPGNLSVHLGVVTKDELAELRVQMRSGGNATGALPKPVALLEAEPQSGSKALETPSDGVVS